MVYRGYDTTLERPVAIKILRQDYSDNSDFQVNFKQEAKSAANLTHPNIVTIHDFGIDRGKLYIVMELVLGSDLKQLIYQKGIFEVDEALSLMTQACAGIGYAHRAGVVHCDIKPLNMLVSTDMQLKVGDFGISRVLAAIHPDEKSDTVWGSPQYFSPEQASGAAPQPASDVYSLGVILFEMLTGRLPFESKDPEELARMHRESLPPTPSKLNPTIPAELDRILLKVLSKEPQARYRTADQFGRILGNLQQLIAHPVAPQVYDLETMQTTIHLEHDSPVITPLSTTSTAATMQTNVQPKRDMKTIVLGFLAFLLAGGLIPFWMYILFRLTSFK